LRRAARFAFPSLALGTLAALAACDVTQVGVTPDGPGNGSATPAGPALVQRQGAGAPPARLLFERVLPEGVDPGQVFAIDSASVDAATALPMGITLADPVELPPSPAYFGLAGSGGAGGTIVSLQATGGIPSIVSTDLETLASRVLFKFSGPLSEVSFGPSGLRAAAIDAAGDVSVIDLSAGSSAPVYSGAQDPAVRAQLAGQALLVRTAGGAAALYRFDPRSSKWERALALASASAAALSSDGERLAAVTSDRKLVVVSTGADKGADAPPTSVVTPIGTLESASVHDLSWGFDGLIYWTRLASGAAELRTLVPSAGAREKTVATLGVPPSVSDGVVCPAVDGDSIYFADLNDGAYRILRATSDGKTTPLFSPPAPDEGFVCPTLEQGDGA
jgi:hypothetical protein